MATRKSRPPTHRRFRVYITAVVAGAIASGTALLLFSFLVFILKLPISQSGFFSLLAFAIGCVVSGFFAGMIKRQGGLGAGIKAALLFMLPVALISFVLGEFSATPPESDSVIILNKVIVAVLCGAVGGVLGVNRNGGF